ncbi:GNAT family N-acetyltransferase [Salinibacillus aidingensis]|uniref:GNAT family N-acetyltransferase n=1 Tax=Salinibacillus aidingensis TaxID=237684 RepID=A0ABP3KH84_9BACI
MIRELSKADLHACMEFIKKSPAENLFLIGDLEAYGVEEDFQDVWGDFDEQGYFRAVLLRYRQNYIIYAPDSFDRQGIAAIIDQDKREEKMVSGISTIVHQVLSHLTHKPEKVRETYYAKCESLNDIQIPDVQVKKSEIPDIPRIVELHRNIADFTNRDPEGESIRKNMEEGVSRTFYIEDREKMVSSAMTTAENSLSAMIIGVCTLEEYKKRGYASACMTALCKELLSEGKHLCLFYDNPEAGKIYKRLGFHDIGKWVMSEFR